MVGVTRATARKSQVDLSPFNRLNVPQTSTYQPTTYQFTETAQNTAEVLGKQVKDAVATVTQLETLLGTGTGRNRLPTPLPKCVVLGDQSTGKSSVIEAISGITTPRSTDTCTRCPLFIQLEKADEGKQWHARVSLRNVYAYDGKKRAKFPHWTPVSVPSEHELGSTNSVVGLEAMIADAQVEALTPFPNREPCEFSPNIVCIYVSHSSLEPLSFYDLPGIIGQTQDASKQYLVKFVKDLVREYIMDALVLLVCSLENDIATSTAAEIARDMRVTSRCVGVLTKPDRLPEGSRVDKLKKMLEGDEYKLGHGYFVVKNPNQGDLNRKLAHDEARSKEREFFSNEEPWSTVFEALDKRFGSKNLQEFVSDQLAVQIYRIIPDLQRDIAARVVEVEADLEGLPAPPSNPVETINDVILEFSELVRNAMRGDNGCISWRNQWDEIHASLSRDLATLQPKLRVSPGKRDTFSDLMPKNSADNAIVLSDDDDDGEIVTAPNPSPKKRKLEEQSSPAARPSSRSGPLDDLKMCFVLDEVSDYLDQHSKSEVPDLVDPKVVAQIMRDTLQNWKTLLSRFFVKLSKGTESALQELFDKKFGTWRTSTIYPSAWKVLQSILKDILEEQEIMAWDALTDELEGPFILHATFKAEWAAVYERYAEAREKHSTLR